MNLNKLLEHLLNEEIFEDYPKGFTFEKLNGIESATEKLKYIRKHLMFHGTGTARTVLLANDTTISKASKKKIGISNSKDTVLKIAKNEAGISQNRAEVEASEKVKKLPYANLIAQVVSFDKDFIWIESERAEHFEDSKWEEATGHSFFDLMDALWSYYPWDNEKNDYMSPERRNEERIKNPPGSIETTQVFKDLVNLIKDTGSVPSDFENHTNWGFIKRDNVLMPVVVDYGLTYAVFDTHYRPGSKGKGVIKEQLHEDIEEIANYPKGFDRWKLSKLKTWEDKEIYLNKHLQWTGSGSSRTVFAADDNTVVKVARNKAGISQNKAEVAAYNKVRNKPYSDLITQVFEYDPDYLWIEAEQAGRYSHEHWENATGFTFNNLIDAIWSYYPWDEVKNDYMSNISKVKERKRNPPNKTERRVENSPLFKDIVQLIKFTNSVPGDLEEPNNWGFVYRDDKLCPVILDYGLSNKVYDKHYAPGSEGKGMLEEQIHEDIEEIAAYPEGFDIKEFVGLRSMAAKARYLKQHNLDKLGAGSARAVFVADATTVIKVAKNAKGLEQNRAEIDISNNSGDDAPIAKVLDFDSANYTYIESERARKAKPTDFKKITGFSMDHIMLSLDVWNKERTGGFGYTKPDTYEQILESPLMLELMDMVGTFNLAIGDIWRISSWGIVNRDGQEHLVLIDYGLNLDILNRLYKRW
jgi:hypothetical protein